MSLFHFRVHIDNLDLEKLVGFIKSNATVLIIVKEIGDRPHIHCLLSPTKTDSTFRRVFLEKFEMCKGNGSYSLKPIRDLEHMKAYCCKGEKNKEPDVVYASDKIDVTSYWKKYWEANAELMSKVADRKDKKSKTNMPWMKEVRLEFIQLHPECYRELGDPYECRWKADKGDAEKKRYNDACKSLLKFIYKKLGNAVKVLDDNVVIKMYKGIENCAITDYAEEDSQVFENYVDHKFYKLIQTW